MGRKAATAQYLLVEASRQGPKSNESAANECMYSTIHICTCTYINVVERT